MRLAYDYSYNLQIQSMRVRSTFMGSDYLIDKLLLVWVRRFGVWIIKYQNVYAVCRSANQLVMTLSFKTWSTFPWALRKAYTVCDMTKFTCLFRTVHKIISSRAPLLTTLFICSISDRVKFFEFFSLPQGLKSQTMVPNRNYTENAIVCRSALRTKLSCTPMGQPSTLNVCIL